MRRNSAVAEPRRDVTRLLQAWTDGQASALERLMPLVVDERAAWRLLRDATPSWKGAEAESILGGCLASQGHFTAAEPLLLSSYADLEDGHAVTTRRGRRALERLVACYEAWGRPDRAALFAAVTPTP